MNRTEKRAKEAVEKFFEAWRDKDWIGMHQQCQTTWLFNHPDYLQWLETHLGECSIESFTIDRIVRRGESSRIAHVTVKIAGEGKKLKKLKIDASVVSEAGPNRPVEDGHWGINPTTVLNIVPGE